MSRFFIDRPVLSIVLSLLILIVGGVSIASLPIARYPEITPPTVQIRAVYPGADAQTVAESVAAPIEQQLAGAKDMLYYQSQSSNDGTCTITVTFEIGTDQDLAAIEVQNRLSVAEPILPQEVVRQGLTVIKVSSSILGVVTLQSDDPTHDDIFLGNYATINLLDRLKRVTGVGDATVFGARDYAMRVWLDPDALTARGLTIAEVTARLRDQNAVFPAGAIGQRPTDGNTALSLPLLTRGRLSEVADRLRREVLDVEVEVAFKRRVYSGIRRTARRTMRLVGVRLPGSREYRFYLTNVAPEDMSAEDVARAYAARWQIELIFKEMKSHYRLDQLPSSKAHIVEALLLSAVITLLVSRRLLAAVREKLRRQRKRVPEQRWAAVFAAAASEILSIVILAKRHAKVIASRHRTDVAARGRRSEPQSQVAARTH